MNNQISTLECNMKEAVNACLGLPAAERPAFVGRYLLAIDEGSPLPPAIPRDTKATTVTAMNHELSALAALLTKAVNHACGEPKRAPLIRIVAERLVAATRTELSDEIKQSLTRLDDGLVEALQRGDIRLVRSAWLLSQPPDFRMLPRQELEDIKRSSDSPSPLLDPAEAVALIRKGDRSAGALTYGWLTPGNPDPAGVRVAIVRRALKEYPYIEAFFWE